MVLCSENSLSYRNFIKMNNLLETSGPVQGWNGIAVPFTLLNLTVTVV